MIRIFSSSKTDCKSESRGSENASTQVLNEDGYSSNRNESNTIQIESRKMTFQELGIAPWLITTLTSLGITIPTEVQSACIPAILSGRDVVAGSRTGSGKTAAFALPILMKLTEDPFGVFAIVLSPTRELALQMAEQFKAFGEGIKLKVGMAVGGFSMIDQSLFISQQRPHVIIATPGRLADMFNSCADVKKACSRTQFLVFDEMDRLLGESCFKEPIGVITEALPGTRQNLFFSATLQENIISMLKDASNSFAKQPLFFNCNVAYENVSTLIQRSLVVPSQVKDTYLVHLLTVPFASSPSVIIFVNKCRTAELLFLTLKELKIASTTLHSKMPQENRIRSLVRFKGARVPILITTDVASRGLDIPAVNLVINYDVPCDPRTYIHRIGRTARAGRGGQALTLVSEADILLVKAIETFIKKECSTTSIESLDESLVKEKEVLALLNPVAKARRIACMALFDSKFGEREQRHQLKMQN